MCCHIVIGHTDKELTRAQWAVANSFLRAMEENLSHEEDCRIVHDILARLYVQSPEQWATQVAKALVGTISQLRAASSKATHEIERLRPECESLRRIMAEYNDNPLQAQVQTLTEERDRWRFQAARFERHAATLEQSLAAAQQAHQEDVAHLQEEISALNHIVFAQQEVINAHNA
jgi:chromosome segregation ATPase